jgi:hypothetical protein
LRFQERGQPHNAKGEADSLVIDHRPLDAALLFSRLMCEKLGDRFSDLSDRPTG